MEEVEDGDMIDHENDIIACCYFYQYLEHVNDNVEGGIGDEHNMVPTSQSFRPWRPVHDVTMLDHLKKTKSALLFPDDELGFLTHR